MSNENDGTNVAQSLDEKLKPLYQNQICPILSVATLNQTDASLVSLGSAPGRRSHLATCAGPRCQWFITAPAHVGDGIVTGCAVTVLARAQDILTGLNVKMVQAQVDQDQLSSASQNKA